MAFADACAGGGSCSLTITTDGGRLMLQGQTRLTLLAWLMLWHLVQPIPKAVTDGR